MEYSLRMTTLVVLWNRKSCVWNYYQDTWHVTTTLCLRKRLWHPGHVHHIGSSLFGQPFLLVTLRNSTEDKIYNLLPLRVCWYVRIPVGAQGTEGSLHHSKDQIINGHDPVGIHEEGLSVNTEICDLNDDSKPSFSQNSCSSNSQEKEEDRIPPILFSADYFPFGINELPAGRPSSSA